MKLFALILSVFVTSTVSAKTINYSNSQWANSCLNEEPTLQLDHPLDFLQTDLSVSMGYIGSGVSFGSNILTPSGSPKPYANIAEPVTPFSSPTVIIAPKSPQGEHVFICFTGHYVFRSNHKL